AGAEAQVGRGEGEERRRRNHQDEVDHGREGLHGACRARSAPELPLAREISAVCTRGGPSALQFANRAIGGDQKIAFALTRARVCVLWPAKTCASAMSCRASTLTRRCSAGRISTVAVPSRSHCRAPEKNPSRSS